MPLTPQQSLVLQEHPLFSGVERLLMETLYDQLEPILYEKEQVVYSPSCFQRSLGVILSGRLEVRKGDAVILNTLRAGDCFGVAALFQPVQQYVTTVLTRSAAAVVFFPEEQLRTLFYQCPQLAVNYISFLSRRITFLNRKIDGFTAASAEEAVALYLLDNLQDGQALIRMGYTQLARQLGVGRATLYRVLDRLEADGLIQRTERMVTVRDPEKLAALLPQLE